MSHRIPKILDFVCNWWGIGRIIGLDSPSLWGVLSGGEIAWPGETMFRFVVAFLLTLALLSGCGGSNEDNGDSMADTIRVVEAYVCTDEYEKARELSIVHIYQRRAVAWVVAKEAERIHAALGYEIFVTGDVLRLADVTESQIRDPDSALLLTPPDQHIDILCCYNPDSRVVGVANPGARAG